MYKLVKIKKWTKELIHSKEFMRSPYRYRTRKLSGTHCGCNSSDSGIAVELYMNNTDEKVKTANKPCICYDGDTNKKVKLYN